MPALSVLLQVVAITHATVVDPDLARPRRDQTIIVRGTRIEAVGPSASTPVPQHARVVNATGKFVIPGMWDMHVHTDVPGGRSLLPLYVAHGVTGVRDMNGRLETLREFQREVMAGRLTGPRMVMSGPFLVGRALPPALGIPFHLVRDSATALAAIAAVAASGADFIKVHNGISAEAYRVIAAEAQRRGIVFAGHVAPPTTVLEAAAAGQRSQEHLYAFVNRCSATDSAIAATALPIQQFIMGTCTTRSQADVYAALARHRTWITPTLLVQELVATMRPTIVAGDRTAYEALFRERCGFVEAESVRRLGCRRDLADDVAQEAWLRIARRPCRCSSAARCSAMSVSRCGSVAFFGTTARPSAGHRP
jgi:hypothetical protein